MNYQSLQSLLSNVDPHALYYLVDQGIQVEKLRLEFLEASKSDTLKSYINIQHGERFLTLLITSGSLK